MSFGDTPQATPPDYAPMAAASEYATDASKEMAKGLGDEAKRQFDINTATAQPVIDTQVGLMKQQGTQSQNYFDYSTNTFRPVEGAAAAQALQTGSDADKQKYIGQAIADVGQGFSRSMGEATREMQRRGMSPDAIAAAAARASTGLASTEAAAANAASTQREAVGFQQKAAVADLGRNLPGASTSAASVAGNLGTSAVGNQMAPGNAYMAGLESADRTAQTGIGQNIAGLGSILQSQTGIYGDTLQARATEAAGNAKLMGAGLGAAATVGAAVII